MEVMDVLGIKEDSNRKFRIYARIPNSGVKVIYPAVYETLIEAKEALLHLMRMAEDRALAI